MIPRALNPSACLCSPPISAHLCQGSNPLWLIGWIYRDYFFSFFLLFFFFFTCPETLWREKVDWLMAGSWTFRWRDSETSTAHQKFEKKKLPPLVFFLSHWWRHVLSRSHPLPLNYDVVSTGRLLQHRSRLITLTSDPLCSEAFRSLRSMHLSSHQATSHFLKKKEKKGKKSYTLKWV